MQYDKIIIGAGLYGIYSALFCAKQGESVIVLERDSYAFGRATYINQARVHMGYHYPRSIATALKSRQYFDRFCMDYSFCIHSKFDQIYATSELFSWTNAEQFRKFCRVSNIPCEDVTVSKYFNHGMCDGAFLTQEYTYDAQMLKDYLLSELLKYPKAIVKFGVEISKIKKEGSVFKLILGMGENLETPFILNATYAGINEIHALLGLEPVRIKYELCEIIICKVNDKLRNLGITVMDGPFFSIMPFGKTGLHSLTAVSFTPHRTCYEALPKFPCQQMDDVRCEVGKLGNCNTCSSRPQSAWPYMSNLAHKYLKNEYEFEYEGSLFSMKPILLTSDIDDSRPTVIRQLSKEPTFISVLSGKINTVYDLDEVLVGEK